MHRITKALARAFSSSTRLFIENILLNPDIGLRCDNLNVHAESRTDARFWISAYDLVLIDSGITARVQSIFRKIKAVADGAANRSRLHIVDSDNLPWAIALQDRNIILTRGAIDVIYVVTDENLDAKDAQMAFVFGHELKHAIDNDFCNKVVYDSFSKRNSFMVKDSPDQLRRKADELRADEECFIYASLAGYDTRALFSTVGTAQDFIHYWTQQTNTISGGGHHTPEKRSQFLQNQFKSLDSAVEYFKYGVRIAHFGHYEDARILLEEFYKI